MTAYAKAVQQLESLGTRRLATAILEGIIPLATTDEWDSESIELLAEPLLGLTEELGLPNWTNATDESMAFWQEVSE